MSTFLRMIPLELQDINDYQEPRMELEDDDHIIGDMSADLKKLYTLWSMYARRFEEAKIDFRFGKLENGSLIYELSHKADVLKDIFWIAVNDEFGLWDRQNIGVRRGYQVVWSERREPDLPPFLRGLLGQDYDS